MSSPVVSQDQKNVAATSIAPEITASDATPDVVTVAPMAPRAGIRLRRVVLFLAFSLFLWGH